MFSQSPSTLYICSANVWRSQMAEWIHNQRFSQLGGAISLAWAEARKKKGLD